MSVEAVGGNSEAGQGAESTSAANQAPGPSQVNGSTKFNSLAELKEKEPELFKKVIEGMAMAMCNKMKRNQERSSRLKKEYMRNA